MHMHVTSQMFQKVEKKNKKAESVLLCIIPLCIDM